MSLLTNLRRPMSIPAKAMDWMVRDLHATWGLAVARIVFGAFTVILVVENWVDRQFFWGVGSAWAQPYRDVSPWGGPLFGFFDHHESATSFTIKFLILGLAGLFMTIGLFSRGATIVVFFLMTSLIALNPVASDTEDWVFRILVLFLCVADTSQRMSVDRWIAGRCGPLVDIGGLRSVRSGLIPMWLRIPLHNGALCLIGAQLIIVYVTAGRAKLSGALWRDGTAIYYPFHAEYLSPWPELTHLLGGIPPMVYFMTWMSIAVQLLFPIMLLQRYTRIFIVFAMVMLHVGIAVTLGLGLFSLAMCGADLAFVRDESVDKVTAWFRRRRAREPEDDILPV